MNKILVSGLINLETTLRVDGFPIPYHPVRYPFFGVRSSVSGVGYNIAKALTRLGDSIHFLSLIGKDQSGALVYLALQEAGISSGGVVAQLDETAQSVILYDGDGRRLINTDLKDIQEHTYPEERFEQALEESSLAVLCNVNFSRPFLQPALRRGVPVATDVHAISDWDDAYNREFMAAARILFQSDELLPCSPEAWVRGVWDRFGAEIVVVGLGAQGALLGVRQDHFLERLPAVQTRPVVNTIGAGDALFSCFVHSYARGFSPELALRRAIVFASYKIGSPGAADGFLDEQGLASWMEKVQAGR